MANPRRSSYSSSSENPFQAQSLSVSSSVKHFLKKPHFIPFLLSISLFLTWVSLRLQHSSHFSFSGNNLRGIQHRKWSKEDDEAANLARFPYGSVFSPIIKGKRGWLLNPISLALDTGIKVELRLVLQFTPVKSSLLYGGEITDNTIAMRLFFFWGARLKNSRIVDKGYAEVVVGADEVAVAGSPSGTAHALADTDPTHTAFFI